MIIKSLELAFHLVAIGGLALVAVMLNHGEEIQALVQAVITGICIVVIAYALTLAKKLTEGKK